MFHKALVAKRLKALVCNTGEREIHVSSNLIECSTSHSGLSAAWSAHLPWERGVVSSNLTVPTTFILLAA